MDRPLRNSKSIAYKDHPKQQEIEEEKSKGLSNELKQDKTNFSFKWRPNLAEEE